MHPIRFKRIDPARRQHHGEPDMPVMSPSTEEPLPRAKEARGLAEQALNELVADANAAGWATDEVVVAIVEAAARLKEASVKDPDPAADPDVSDVPADGGQLGHGETFD
jgi:hypothetical protein